MATAPRDSGRHADRGAGRPLARDFQVIAHDQRRCGLSGKPEDGYDTGTLAAGHRDRVDRVAVAKPPFRACPPSPPLSPTRTLIMHATLQGTARAHCAKHVGGVVAGRELPHDPAENFREVGLRARAAGGPIVHDRLQSRSPFGEHIHDLL